MVNGTLIWYYFICKREVWLMSRNIKSNQDDDNIKLGRFIHENTYKKNKKEIMIGNVKFDLLKKKKNCLIIGEIKKSSNYTISSEYQLLYYLRELKNAGFQSKGELLFPEEKKKIVVELTAEKESELEKIISEIEEIINQELPIPPVKNKFCHNCAYNEFCWA